jgi:hypothetical protein
MGFILAGSMLTVSDIIKVDFIHFHDPGTVVPSKFSRYGLRRNDRKLHGVQFNFINYHSRCGLHYLFDVVRASVNTEKKIIRVYICEWSSDCSQQKKGGDEPPWIISS